MRLRFPGDPLCPWPGYAHYTGGDPRALVRFKESEAAALGLAATDERTTAEWAAVLSAHPRLIERPVLETRDRAVIGRPAERFDELL